MKIPERYIEDLNKIIEEKDRYNTVQLFYAYTKLWALKDVFKNYGMTSEDEEFDRLLTVLVEIEMKIAIRLHINEEMEKWRGKNYEGKS